MIEIDGSAGGGQILRSALTLSAITGNSIRIINIRGARSNPGLRSQHLAAVTLLSDICQADVSDVSVGATELTFSPGTITTGRFEVEIGTAGSLPLVFDSVLPLATTISAPLEIHGRGGTDVRWAPTLDYFSHVKLGLLRAYGLSAAIECERRGFYPAGGGRATLHIQPSSLDSITLQSRGDLQSASIWSRASTTLKDRSVAERQAQHVESKLSESGIHIQHSYSEYVQTKSPGSVLTIRLNYSHCVAGFAALGEPGKPAEDVGLSAVKQAQAFIDTSGAVDEHMADQLLIFLSLTGGRIAIPKITNHIITNSDLLELFGVNLDIIDNGPPYLIETTSL